MDVLGKIRMGEEVWAYLVEDFFAVIRIVVVAYLELFGCCVHFFS